MQASINNEVTRLKNICENEIINGFDSFLNIPSFIV